MRDQISQNDEHGEMVKNVFPELVRQRFGFNGVYVGKLDEEQLKVADLENQLSRMEEDLNFKMQLLEKELTEVKS